jgi:hypothetical protein
LLIFLGCTGMGTVSLIFISSQKSVACSVCVNGDNGRLDKRGGCQVLSTAQQLNKITFLMFY